MGHKRANQFRAAAANKEKLAIARIKRRQTQFITGIQNELLNRIFTDEVDPETGLKVAGPGILSLFEGREGFGQIGAAQQAALGRAQQASSRRIGELAQERGGLGGGFETAAQLQNFLQFGALRSQASEESARTRLQQEIGLTQGALGQASQFATGLQIQPISNIQQFSPGRSGVGGALGQLGGQIFGNLAADFFRGNTVFNKQPGATAEPSNLETGLNTAANVAQFIQGIGHFVSAGLRIGSQFAKK